MAFTEDFAPFFADFGEPATPGAGSAITVIFDRAQIAAMGGDISGTMPVALAQTADAAAFTAHTTHLTIRSIPYTVRDIQPDGTGLSVLVLEVD